MNAAAASEEGPLCITREKMAWGLAFRLWGAFLSLATKEEPDPWVHFESFLTWLALVLAIQPDRDAWFKKPQQ